MKNHDFTSRLSKYYFVQQHKDLLKLCPLLNPLSKLDESEANRLKRKKNRGTYQNLKEQSIDYQNAKDAFITTLEEMGLGSWYHAEGGHDMFSIE